MFGDWGALLVQFLVTAVVVLGLIAIVYWLVRRYSAAGLGRIGRGRVPRLALVDAVSVDARRRLVLVRRDNVEHLLLIGGPSDVVVEQTIQRPRRPKTATEPDLPAPEPAEDARTALPAATHAPAQLRSSATSGQNGVRGVTGESERPFSFRRPTALPAPSPTPVTHRNADAISAGPPARFVDVHNPTRVEAAAAAPSLPAEPGEPPFPDLPTAELPQADDDPAPPAQNGGDPRPADFDLAGTGPAEARPATAERSPYAKPESNGGDAGKLADLENEMARLLGEITQKRHS